jgi:hypothetical protein
MNELLEVYSRPLRTIQRLDDFEICSTADLWSSISTKSKDTKGASIIQANSYLTVNGDSSSDRGPEEESSAGFDCLTYTCDSG